MLMKLTVVVLNAGSLAEGRGPLVEKHCDLHVARIYTLSLVLEAIQKKKLSLRKD
jgi:hypothetical protein